MASDALVEDEKGACRFSSSLSSAVSEWLLILLLFLNGFFSYLVTMFARYCKLQIPCLFCSRLDHVLDHESPGFYDNLICNCHKLEISSLAYCHIHQKLADVREMCESCLLSFATEKKSNSDTYRSLVGKLEINTTEDKIITKIPEIESDGLKSKLQGEDVTQVPLLKNGNMFSFLRKRCCSCCHEPFRMKSFAHRLLQTKSVAADVSEPDSPGLGLNALPRSLSSLRRDSFNKRKESFVAPHAVSHGNSGFDQLSHFGYTELKITSDSESEVPVSDDDDGNAIVQGSVNVKEEYVAHSMQSSSLSVDANNLPKHSTDDIVREKMIDPVTSDSLLAVTEQQVHLTEPSVASFLETDGVKSHGLEELSWNELEGGAGPTMEVSNSKHIMDIGETECSSSPSIEVSKAMDSLEICSRSNQVINESVLSIPSVLDLNDAYKLVIVSKGNEPPSKDSSQVHEDLKLLLTQISRGLEFPWNDMSPSPRLRGLVHEDSKVSDALGTSGLLTFTRRPSLERNESGFESSIDGSIFSEIEGESAVEKLKRHVEFDRKSLSLLYKELEEERSASAIAANQAMAMITRLQEEKAAMQMEALQYQRMMDEQAEYDQEALQRSNDLLVQREKEIQALEIEVAGYRSRFNNDSDDEKTPTLLDNNEERGNSRISKGHSGQHEGCNKSPRADKFLLDSDRNQNTTLGDPLLKFDEEKAYISECLKRLEKKLHLSSKSRLNVERERVPPEDEIKSTQFPEKETFEKDDDVDNGSSLQKDSHLSRESSHLKAENAAELVVMDNHEHGSLAPNINGSNQQSSPFGRETNTTDIENEISQLSDRLESLEADKNLLEHMINSLQNGKEGLEFVREIACHVRKLRKAGISRREQ